MFIPWVYEILVRPLNLNFSLSHISWLFQIFPDILWLSLTFQSTLTCSNPVPKPPEEKSGNRILVLYSWSVSSYELLGGEPIVVEPRAILHDPQTLGGWRKSYPYVSWTTQKEGMIVGPCGATLNFLDCSDKFNQKKSLQPLLQEAAWVLRGSSKRTGWCTRDTQPLAQKKTWPANRMARAAF